MVVGCSSLERVGFFHVGLVHFSCFLIYIVDTVILSGRTLCWPSICSISFVRERVVWDAPSVEGYERKFVVAIFLLTGVGGVDRSLLTRLRG